MLLGLKSAKDLIDSEKGLVSREIFVNEDIYRQEQDQVFGRVWLFVGHESHIVKPCDYFVSYMGEDSVILTRDRSNQIHVFLNSCRHRGMKVCRYDEGNTPVFTCPYHGWSYALDGKLVGVPYHKEAYNEDLDKSQWGLVEVAQLSNYKGTIWATWDKSAPPFLEYIGDMKIFLDGLLDSYDGQEGGSEIIGGIHKWQVPCNWKFVAENFAGDHYHGVSHSSVEAVGIGPGHIGQTRHGNARSYRASLTCFPYLGHCWRGSPPQPVEEDVYPFPTFQDPNLEAYFRHIYEERLKRPQKWPPVWVFGGGGNVFPNTSFHVGFPRGILVSHPRGPLLTEMWRWYLVDKDAPKEVKDFWRHYLIRYSGPAGMTEQDDMENWNYATAASKGTIARRFPYNYQQGLGRSRPYSGLRGAWVSERKFSEANALALYKRWADLMDAKSWDEIALNR